MLVYICVEMYVDTFIIRTRREPGIGPKRARVPLSFQTDTSLLTSQMSGHLCIPWWPEVTPFHSQRVDSGQHASWQ
jgi:hypothetical protein